jgi:hypothetical protein
MEAHLRQGHNDEFLFFGLVEASKAIILPQPMRGLNLLTWKCCMIYSNFGLLHPFFLQGRRSGFRFGQDFQSVELARLTDI